MFPALHIVRRPHKGRTAVIIPTRNRWDLLHDCIESIRPALERNNAELVIVDNDSVEPDTLKYLAKIKGNQTRVLRVPGEFNFPRLNNYAAKRIKSACSAFVITTSRRSMING